MHELSIAVSILEIVEEEMVNHAGAQVEAIHLKLGPLSGVVKEALSSAYELASEQSPFAGSRLIFEDAPIVVYCHTCQAERPVFSIQHFCCAVCGIPASEVVHGREMQVSALELQE